MGNFFNNEPTILRLIVRVCIYHTLIYIQENNVDLKKTGLLRIFFLEIYRSQTDYTNYKYTPKITNKTLSLQMSDL